MLDTRARLRCRSLVASRGGWGPTARYARSRLYVVERVLRGCGGDLLDIGCGSGALVGRLLDTRPGDFRITAADRSPAIVASAALLAAEPAAVRVAAADIEAVTRQP